MFIQALKKSVQDLPWSCPPLLFHHHHFRDWNSLDDRIMFYTRFTYSFIHSFFWGLKTFFFRNKCPPRLWFCWMQKSFANFTHSLYLLLLSSFWLIGLSWFRFRKSNNTISLQHCSFQTLIFPCKRNKKTDIHAKYTEQMVFLWPSKVTHCNSEKQEVIYFKVMHAYHPILHNLFDVLPEEGKNLSAFARKNK